MENDRSDSVGRAVRFGAFVFDAERGELSRDGQRVRLRPKATRVLTALLGTPGALVTHEELARAAWGDVRSDVDSSLHNVISELREALGDDASRPRYVETVHRRGYCFVAPVEAVPDEGEPGGETDSEPDGTASERPDGPRGLGRRTTLRVAVLLALLAAALMAIGLGSRSDGTTDPDPGVTDAILRGRYLVDHGGPEEIEQGRALLRQAIEDGAANSAFAWGSVASAEAALWRLEEAATAARRALQLDPESADAFRVLGQLDLYERHDWESAERHLVRSLSVDPDVAGTHVAYAQLLLILGRHDDALREARLARSLAPLSPQINEELAWVLARTEQYEDAAAQARRTLQLDPDHADAWAVLHTSRRARGELDGARDALVESLARRDAPEELLAAMRSASPEAGLRIGYEWFLQRMLGPEGAGRPHRHYRSALAYMFLDMEEAAWRQLLAAERRGEPLVAFASADPRFAPLRDHPGFRALMARLGVPPRD